MERLDGLCPAMTYFLKAKTGIRAFKIITRNPSESLLRTIPVSFAIIAGRMQLVFGNSLTVTYQCCYVPFHKMMH